MVNNLHDSFIFGRSQIEFKSNTYIPVTSLILNVLELGKSYFFGKMDTATELLHKIYQHKHKPKSGGAGIVRRRILLRSLGNYVTDGASFLFGSLYQ